MNDPNLYEIVKPLAKNFPIKFAGGRGKGIYPAHWHEAIELLYFEEAGADVYVGGVHFQPGAGDLILVNRNELHALEKKTPIASVCLRFLPAFFADLQTDSPWFQTVISGDASVQQFFSRIKEIYREDSEVRDVQVKGECYLFLSYLLRNYRAETPGGSLVEKQKRLERISTILRFIANNYSAKLTTRSLAEHFYLDESYFCNFFKAETGQTVLQYLNAFRVEKAAVLLQNTELSVTEVACRVGFDDPNYFARVFRRHMGGSARDFQKNGQL